jgi:hypothetical protein
MDDWTVVLLLSNAGDYAPDDIGALDSLIPRDTAYPRDGVDSGLCFLVTFRLGLVG